MLYPYLISDLKNLTILYIISLISVFITAKYDLNIFDSLKKTKEKQIILFLLFLLIKNNLLKLAFYWIKDYFLEIEFYSNWEVEKSQLSLLEIFRQSLIIFLIFTFLYFLFYA